MEKRMKIRLKTVPKQQPEARSEHFGTEGGSFFCGIDNGVSGAVTIMYRNGNILLHENTPTIDQQSYTKEEKRLRRVDYGKMKAMLSKLPIEFCFIERPMVNPKMFTASVSALRCLEATQIILEELRIPYEFVDSKQWQSELLPRNIQLKKLKKGEKRSKKEKDDRKKQLKQAAFDVVRRLFPKVEIKNADSILIAEFCRRSKR